MTNKKKVIVIFFTMSSLTSIYNCRNILEDQILGYIKIIYNNPSFFNILYGFQSRIFNDCKKKDPIRILKEKNNAYLYHDYVIQHLFFVGLKFTTAERLRKVFKGFSNHSNGFNPMDPFLHLYLRRCILANL